MEQKLARIANASLNIKETGILTFWINVDYEEGCSQGIGGYALDTYDKDKKCRVGTAYGREVIRQLFEALNVNYFSEMQGKLIYILGDGEGLAFRPTGIKTLRLDGNKSVIFDQILADMQEPGKL